MLTVLATEAVPEHLRGFLSRYLIEVRSGLFVGTVSPRVNESLWEAAVDACHMGSVVLAYASKADSGFDLRCHNLPRSRLVSIDGYPVILRVHDP